MVDIVIVRSNSIIYNPRVGKMVRSLTKRYSISVLGWNREGLSKKIVDNYIVRLKLFNLRAPYGKLYLFVYFPLYWIWVLYQLLFVFRPKAVHACDLDSAIPAFLYKVISRSKLVFDVCDRYAMTYIPTKFNRLYSIVNSLEELIGSKSDALINVSAKLLETFGKRPKLCAIVMNCSEDRNMSHKVYSERDDKSLRLLYTGIILRTRGLKEVALAIRDLDRVQLDIAGRVIHKDILDEILQLPNVKYHGFFQPSDISALQARSDAMMVLYDLSDPISSYSMGNKMFEAMMFGLPVITNIGSDLLEEAECGILVNYNDSDQIKAAIISLRDNIDLRRSLGENGRNAFLQKYNWKMMEPELYKIYVNLLK
ncbi:MAG: glycosyltransferase [Nitrososphaeraceae archaeon]|nr:glycosyltransferase [Nitrososphaeraceae archaeon]